ncbi:sulfotransferase family protein [Pontibacter flavimaris]|uniref:Sulfotransferase n=1 Tax=Pontibacter flavimaris TaxID=1797110 RepID=A0A1Q5PCG6_9BACT|nr:sulfotransferase [Pontibacter flavimaris]OKL39884.1 hypothetical protein A3841_16030 [Pontibacter flavimaris]
MSQKVNLFLVGAMKAGTTSLTKLLDMHQQIFVCPIKEPNFFITDLPKSLDDTSGTFNLRNFIDTLQPESKKHYAHVKDFHDYEALFKFHNHEMYLADCSTAYLHSKEAAEAIKKYNPDAKIIILIRDPVKRAFSHYKMDLGIGRTDKSFLEEWGAIDRKKGEWNYYSMSLYADAIAYYQRLFGADQVLVETLENMNARPEPFKLRLGQFLSLDFENIEINKENESVNPRFPLLNNIMHRMGTKRAFRKILSEETIMLGKSFFYTNRRETLDTATYQEIKECFCLDIERTEKLIGFKLNYN